MEGKINQNPAAELIREIAAAKLSGALRLSHGQAQAAVYFETGTLTFAASNLRAHRLPAVLKRGAVLSEDQLAKLPATSSDEELLAAIEQGKLLDACTLAKVREQQVADVLRAILLWTDGLWKFDQRVRLAGNARVRIDVSRLLRECARHLPEDFVASRFNGTDPAFERAPADISQQSLTPAESSLFSKAEPTTKLSKLIELGRLNQEKSQRAIYGLWLAGALHCRDWPKTFAIAAAAENRAGSAAPIKSERPEPESVTASTEKDAKQELETFFARLERAADHYEVLDVVRQATAEEIKSAYHDLARRFHPDRFHRSHPELRSQIDSAFARIAQAYEHLSDQSLRAAYDRIRARRSPKVETQSSKIDRQQSVEAASDHEPASGTEINRAEVSFQAGMNLLKQNRREEATRFFAEAATLEPRQARYRAHYGQMLIGQANMRRVAEVELQAALALEPENSSYRVMLAELYRALGLRRRAEGELQRALAADPKNEEAHLLLSSLKK